MNEIDNVLIEMLMSKKYRWYMLRDIIKMCLDTEKLEDMQQKAMDIVNAKNNNTWYMKIFKGSSYWKIVETIHTVKTNCKGLERKKTIEAIIKALYSDLLY